MFLRKTKSFSKSRYSRSRQLSRVIFYVALTVNIIIIYGVFYFIYSLSLLHFWSWWLYYVFLISSVASFFFRTYK